ncbi:phage tail length tape measure family protein [Mesorhizobium qingshengii]|uniref:Prophage tail length tape measure protein n=1 Tax=Mesorhizobium qingshengii TaxID=1165689 RepID=A0A1G5V0F1_9HYPH|nr:phage tail length tape measure family protein [Mesorhizobium qingshengii]SDA39108.1 Prophage tail length tape measure protein [Mesorhizobium qingshengii]
MTLNLALVISGEASGAKAAADQTATAVRTVGVAATEASAAMVSAEGQAEAAARRVTDALTTQTAAQRAVATQSASNVVSIGNASKLTANQLLNLSRQGNDVITMFALGAPPMQIFASQAGQIYDALEQGPGGIKGSLKGIGESLLGLITRFPIATAAIAAAGVAFITYEMFAEAKIKSVNEILKQHEANIHRLGPAYEEALKGITKYADESERLANLRLRTDAADALKTQADEATKAIENIVKSEGIFSSRFSGAKGAIDDFMASIKAGNPDAVKFQETIASLRDSGQITEKVAQDLITASNAAYEAQRSLSGISGNVDAVAKAIADMSRALGADALSALSQLSTEQRKYVQTLIDQLNRGQITADQFKASLQSLSGVTPDFSGAIDQVSGLADQLERAHAAAAGLANTTPRQDRVGYNRMDDAQSQYGDALEMWRRFGYDNDSKIDTNKPKKVPKASTADPYRDILKSAQDRIDQMKVELQLTGQVGVAADTLRNYQELLSKATDKGRSIGEAQKAELHDRAEEMAKLAAATAGAKVQQDLLFDRQQMFRSPTEQDVYSTLRSANIDPASATGEAIAQQIRYNDLLKESRDLAGDFASTLIGGLRNGENGWQAMGDAALSVLDKITDKLLNEVLDALFQINSAGGGGGGILGALGSLFGLGGGGSAGSNPGSVSDLLSSSWSFDSGGYTGPGPKNRPAGVVHAGEVVFSQDDIARAGGVGVVEAMRLGRRGYASGGVVEGGMAMPATGTYGGGATWSGGSPQPQRVVLHIVNEEGPMFRTTIRQESQDVAVQVVRGNDQARADYYDAGGNPR